MGPRAIEPIYVKKDSLVIPQYLFVYKVKARFLWCPNILSVQAASLRSKMIANSTPPPKKERRFN